MNAILGELNLPEEGQLDRQSVARILAQLTDKLTAAQVTGEKGVSNCC